ncbi:hypothetical protein OS493_020080 [Desmophyllum pertusum]|uniref:Uncharacterized protein n=1 Tax=Desmophyllum pertusum TaxID=174260 RepID=A0A9W9YBU6_9CNID|nr:hypothetical protein OS493_020080 [Desmophyllum pertusum]
MNNEEGEGLPEYQTLEPEESVSNQDPDEPDNHDYNVLEEPETACDEVDEQIVNTEDNPAYAKPLDTKEEPDLSLEPSEILNIEDNPANAQPLDTKEDSDLNLEPSEILNIRR